MYEADSRRGAQECRSRLGREMATLWGVHVGLAMEEGIGAWSVVSRRTWISTGQWVGNLRETSALYESDEVDCITYGNLLTRKQCEVALFVHDRR